jgi:broad specificity phosphatase PhoE
MITVILVRHADIDLPRRSDDPPLNAAGRRRAEMLAYIVRRAGATSLFTSTFLRTVQTMQPLATQAGLVPQAVPTANEWAQQVVAGALGEVVVVAGHSNTVPEMLEALGVPPPAPPIGESEFDNLFVATVASPGNTHVAHLRYGKPPPNLT